MSEPKTLLQLAGADLSPSKVRDACLIMIDMQNEYLEGPIAVDGAEAAISNAAQLLAAARSAGAPLFHIAHKGKAGSLFDRDGHRGQIVSQLTPADGETVVEKGLPNAFAGTDLADRVAQSGCKELVLCGFMTHMCVSSTARAALDLGYRTTVVADACGTRPLPNGQGGTLPANVLHDVALAELADRFAIVAPTAGEVV